MLTVVRGRLLKADVQSPRQVPWHSGWFDGEWSEINAFTNVLVRVEFLQFCSCCCWTGLPAVACTDMRMCWGRWHPKPDNGPSSTESELLHLVSLSLRPQSEWGSRVTYALAVLNARHNISLTWLWRQDSPWRPLTVTSMLHTHLCGRMIGAPSCRPTATWMVTLSILSPKLDSGARDARYHCIK